MALPNALSTQQLGIDKVDYQPVVDPATDRSADQVNDAFAAVAGMSATCMKAVLRFDAVATAGPVVLTAFASVWGAGISQRPVVTRTTTGRYEVEFPAQITSLMNTTEDLNILVSIVNVSTGSMTDARASARVLAPNLIEIQLNTTVGNDDCEGEQVTLAVI